MTQKVIIKATKIAPYGKGYQVNAFVNGVESEQTFYGVAKTYAVEQAKRIIKQNGRLNGEPYKGEYALFSEAQRKQILKQFQQVVVV